jgi:hypothetical protein
MNSTESIKLSMQLIKMLLMLILYVHCLGCLWYFVATTVVEDDTFMWTPPTFIAYADDDFWSLSDSEKYIISFYHSSLMLTGNDIYPKGSLLTLLAAVSGIAGALVNANIFGNIAIIV